MTACTDFSPPKPVEYRNMTPSDYASASRQKRLPGKFERGIVADMNGDGRDEYVAAVMRTRREREENRGRIEVYSNGKLAYISPEKGGWNLSCDSMFVEDIDNNDSPELFVDVVNAYGANTYWKERIVYVWKPGKNFTETCRVGMDYMTEFDDVDNDGIEEISVFSDIFGGECHACPHRQRIKIYKWDGDKFELAYERETHEYYEWEDRKKVIAKGN